MLAAATGGGVWGAVVNFSRVGKKGQGGGDGDGEDDGDDGLGAGSGGGSKGGRKRGRGEAGGEEAAAGKLGGEPAGADKWTVDVLVNGEEGWNGREAAATADGRPRLRVARVPPVAAGGKCNAHVVTFPLAYVDGLSSVRVYIHKDLRPPEAIQVRERLGGRAFSWVLIPVHGLHHWEGVRSVVSSVVCGVPAGAPPTRAAPALRLCCACCGAQQSCRTIGETVARLVAAHGRVPLLDPKDDMKVRARGVGCSASGEPAAQRRGCAPRAPARTCTPQRCHSEADSNATPRLPARASDAHRWTARRFARPQQCRVCLRARDAAPARRWTARRCARRCRG